MSTAREAIAKVAAEGGSGKSHSLAPGDCTSYRGHKGPHYPKQAI